MTLHLSIKRLLIALLVQGIRLILTSIALMPFLDKKDLLAIIGNF